MGGPSKMEHAHRPFEKLREGYEIPEIEIARGQ